jgi:hypothetical protein
MDVICNYIDVHPKWHPRGRWLNFESLAAVYQHQHQVLSALRGPWGYKNSAHRLRWYLMHYALSK